MKDVEAKAVYFERPGPENTARTLRLARKRAQELGIKTVLVASTQGETGVKACQMLKGLKVIVVTHVTGFKEPNTQELLPENRERILKLGGAVFTATHAFGGVGRAVRRRLNTYQTEEIIAHALRIFGQGVKVGCEMALMAADAGLVRTDEEIITVAGTDRGADTAVVLRPAHAQDFFSLRVNEIICKPRL